MEGDTETEDEYGRDEQEMEHVIHLKQEIKHELRLKREMEHIHHMKQDLKHVVQLQ